MAALILFFIFIGTPADAGFIAVIVALTSNGVAFLPALWAVAGSSVLALGRVLLFSALSQAFTPRPRSPELIRQLQTPNTLPPYRFAYGHTRLYGSYVAWHVDGDILYACMLLNSRPSSGNFTVFFDKREVEVTGDIYDFSGGGATATNDPFSGYTNLWIGRGDQTAPPTQITTEQSSKFAVTDAWEGRTVLWMRLDAGPNASRGERWVRVPPEIEVKGDWSLVYDPREVSHDIDDPDTWAFSSNQALCLMDALRTNPIRQYQAKNLMLDTFEDAADVADETVTINAGGSESRYETNGVLIFSDGSEIEDQVQPLALAGGGDMIRVGGRLGYAAGEYRSPTYTLTEFKPPVEFTRYKRSQGLPTRVRCSYVSSDRDYEMAELEPWDIPGAQSADGGIASTVDVSLGMVTSPYQAMRIRKIFGLKARQQKSLTLTAPPTAFDVIAGANITVDIPAPYEKYDGVYMVTDINPAFNMTGQNADQVAMVCPLSCVETSPAIYAWDETTEEEVIISETYDPTVAGIQAPGAIGTETGPSVDLDTGSTIITRIRFDFDPSSSASVSQYAWEWRLAGDVWTTGGTIDATTVDGDGDVFGYLSGVSVLETYQIRAKAQSPYGESAWVETADIALGINITVSTVTPGTGEITFDGTGAASGAFAGVILYRNTTDDFDTATAITGTIAVSPSASFSITATGVTAGAAFFWAVGVTSTGALGNESASYNETIL